MSREEAMKMALQGIKMRKLGWAKHEYVVKCHSNKYVVMQDGKQFTSRCIYSGNEAPNIYNYEEWEVYNG